MTANLDSKEGGELIPSRPASSLVVRTANVPVEAEYGRYRRYLRVDFFYRCAYCTINEAEAAAIRFTIDHYEPQTAREDLIAVYSNLMYACDECNTRKGNRYPPESARKDGFRFFRPDQDIFSDHFAGQDMLLSHKSNVGSYTIDALDLNRGTLRRLRELRLRLLNCEKYATEGITALRDFRIDQLPQAIRARAQRAIKDAMSAHDELAANIDDVLRENAKSFLLDKDDDLAHAATRNANLKHLEGLYPESWRAPIKKKKKQKK
jgi:hypothetical protein